MALGGPLPLVRLQTHEPGGDISHTDHSSRPFSSMPICCVKVPGCLGSSLCQVTWGRPLQTVDVGGHRWWCFSVEGNVCVLVELPFRGSRPPSCPSDCSETGTRAANVGLQQIQEEGAKGQGPRVSQLHEDQKELEGPLVQPGGKHLVWQEASSMDVRHPGDTRISPSSVVKWLFT